VDDPRARRIATVSERDARGTQRIDERVGPVARAGMDHEPRWLRDHEQVLVTMPDGRERWWVGDLVGDHLRDLDDLTGHEGAATPGGTATDRHAARLDAVDGCTP
jgi:hypothetical protein